MTKQELNKKVAEQLKLLNFLRNSPTVSEDHLKQVTEALEQLNELLLKSMK